MQPNRTQVALSLAFVHECQLWMPGAAEQRRSCQSPCWKRPSCFPLLQTLTHDDCFVGQYYLVVFHRFQLGLHPLQCGGGETWGDCVLQRRRRTSERQRFGSMATSSFATNLGIFSALVASGFIGLFILFANAPVIAR